MRARRRAAGARLEGALAAGFSLAELMVVAAIISLTTYVVALSFDAIVPQERLNTAIRNLTAVLRDARSQAISRNLAFAVEYDLPGRRYRVITPYNVEGRLHREGYDEEETRSIGTWELLPDGVEFRELHVAGERYAGEVPYRVEFDGRGSATEHSIVLAQSAFDTLTTIEVMALSGHFRIHPGLYQREVVREEDFR